jgi:hypothetical protein
MLSEGKIDKSKLSDHTATTLNALGNKKNVQKITIEFKYVELNAIKLIS